MTDAVAIAEGGWELPADHLSPDHAAQSDRARHVLAARRRKTRNHPRDVPETASAQDITS